MKITNPWPHYPMSRCVCRTPEGESTRIQSSRGPTLDVPEGTTAAMIEPVRMSGRGGGCEVVGDAKIWTAVWGLLDVADYEKKMQLEADEKAMAERKEAERLRKQEEAKQRAAAEKKAKEAEAKAAKEEKAKPKPKEAKPESKEQTTGPKIRLDDERK